MKKNILIILTFLFVFSGCTIYTEKRSEALSRAVMATSDSINTARFDLAEKFAEESIKLAYAPKHKIKITPIVTKRAIKVENSKVEKPINTTLPKEEDLRIVVSEKLKDASLLVVKSEEWNELLQTKEFAKSLERDNVMLVNLKREVEKELTLQNEMKEKMIRDLNSMQKKLIEKDLFILRLEITLAGVIGLFMICIYLRIKGIL